MRSRGGNLAGSDLFTRPLPSADDRARGSRDAVRASYCVPSQRNNAPTPYVCRPYEHALRGWPARSDGCVRCTASRLETSRTRPKRLPRGGCARAVRSGWAWPVNAPRPSAYRPDAPIQPAILSDRAEAAPSAAAPDWLACLFGRPPQIGRSERGLSPRGLRQLRPDRERQGRTLRHAAPCRADRPRRRSLAPACDPRPGAAPRCSAPAPENCGSGSCC